MTEEEREREYVRLTTVGKIIVALPVIAELQTAMRLAGFEGQVAELAHAYEGLRAAWDELANGDSPVSKGST